MRNGTSRILLYALCVCLLTIYLIIRRTNIWNVMPHTMAVYEYDIFLPNVRRSMEEHCRHIFEYAFACPFPRGRYGFLKNPCTGRDLELDGYNPTIPTALGKGIAFEYNGRQHYDTCNGTYSETFVVLLRNRDRVKVHTCQRVGIYLIVIPYTVNTFAKAYTYIYNTLACDGYVSMYKRGSW